ncbi:MAG: hypothetical protein DA405_08625 [Bacteroidetes bacterium]|nr:MAG: hypothetical protein DA405_08625 [Bacteroidota bacterium]
MLIVMDKSHFLTYRVSKVYMVRIILCATFILATWTSINGQVESDAIQAWKSLHRRDQIHPSKRTEASTKANLRDACNLMLKFGYPDTVCSPIRDTPVLTLIHCKWPTYQLAAYPIFYEAYFKGFIDTLEMANYVTRAVHYNLFRRNSIKFYEAISAARFIDRFNDLIVSYSSPPGNTFKDCDSCHALLIRDFAISLDTLLNKGKFVGEFELSSDPFYWRIEGEYCKVKFYQFHGTLYYLPERSSIGFKLRRGIQNMGTETQWYQYPPYISSESLAVEVGYEGLETLNVKVNGKIYKYPRVNNN